MRKVLFGIVFVLVAALLLVSAYIYRTRYTHPDLGPFRGLFATPAAPGARAGGTVQAQFLGVSTLLLTDGETNLLTDGYFSRIGLFQFLFAKVAPDREAIRRALLRSGISKLDAVMVVHSHFDHAMDAPLVAELTGARLLGSESTANVGRGLGFPEARIDVVRDRTPRRFGRFRVSFHPNKHTDLADWLAKRISNQEIKKPLVPPTSAFEYKEGQTWSILVEHPRGNAVIHASAGFLPDALRHMRADTIFLGIGGAGKFSDEHFRAYLDATVFAVGAKVVIPIHWDDMFRSADQPLLPGQDFPEAMRRLQAASDGGRRFRIVLLPGWQSVALF